MNERRRKLIPVRDILFMQQHWHTGDIVHAKCTDGLPADAAFIGLTYDHMRDTYYFCYQSAEWDEVPDGMMLPIFSPAFTNLYVASFLGQAEALIEAYSSYNDGPDSGPKWLEAYRAFKARTGWPE